MIEQKIKWRVVSHDKYEVYGFKSTPWAYGDTFSGLIDFVKYAMKEAHDPKTFYVDLFDGIETRMDQFYELYKKEGLL